MFKQTTNARALRRILVLGCSIAGSMALASAALAGECPADKTKANAREMVDYKPVGVTDVTLGSIDLEKQPAHIAGREPRFRKLTIEPGGRHAEGGGVDRKAHRGWGDLIMARQRRQDRLRRKQVDDGQECDQADDDRAQEHAG